MNLIRRIGVIVKVPLTFLRMPIQLKHSSHLSMRNLRRRLLIGQILRMKVRQPLRKLWLPAQQPMKNKETFQPMTKLEMFYPMERKIKSPQRSVMEYHSVLDHPCHVRNTKHHYTACIAAYLKHRVLCQVEHLYSVVIFTFFIHCFWNVQQMLVSLWTKCETCTCSMFNMHPDSPICCLWKERSCHLHHIIGCWRIFLLLYTLLACCFTEHQPDIVFCSQTLFCHLFAEMWFSSSWSPHSVMGFIDSWP